MLCINKSDRFDPYERISVSGAEMLTARLDAVAERRDRRHRERHRSFFVRRGGHVVNVIVSKSRYGHEYLKTVADGDQPDNLLALPECR